MARFRNTAYVQVILDLSDKSTRLPPGSCSQQLGLDWKIPSPQQVFAKYLPLPPSPQIVHVEEGREALYQKLALRHHALHDSKGVDTVRKFCQF
jgi:hypothetical protein